jgi:hypothetical protein
MGTGIEGIAAKVFPLQRPKLSVPYMRMKALAVL